MTRATDDSNAEKKVQRELFALGVEANDDFDIVLKMFGLHKAMRICAWIWRVNHDSRHSCEKIIGPLTIKEIQQQKMSWIKRGQSQEAKTVKFALDQEQLNLQLHTDGVLEYRGCIQGEHPIYLPDSNSFTAEIVKRVHETTVHGGVSMTIAEVRERFWVPRLQWPAKKVVKHYFGCKRFQAQPLHDPPAGDLPKSCTEGSTPFDVIGVDFAGPIKYSGKCKTEKKACIVLYSCCLTYGIFLEVLPSLP